MGKEWKPNLPNSYLSNLGSTSRIVIFPFNDATVWLPCMVKGDVRCPYGSVLTTKSISQSFLHPVGKFLVGVSKLGCLSAVWFFAVPGAMSNDVANISIFGTNFFYLRCFQRLAAKKGWSFVFPSHSCSWWKMPDNPMTSDFVPKRSWPSCIKKLKVPLQWMVPSLIS